MNVINKLLLMKKERSTIFVLFIILFLSLKAQEPVAYVNPMIGTNGMGHTFPGACSPFGLVQLSPDTDTIPHNVNGVYQKNVYEYCAGYQYRDKTIVGFSHTHLSGTGHSDLGDILIMPATGPLKLNLGRADHPDEGYRSSFSHSTEKASPGYYEVMLDDYGIKAQLTATQRVGIHKYTFPKAGNGHLILDLIHGIYNYDGKVLWASIRVENDTLLTGYRITNGWARTNYTYFAITFSQPIKEYGYKDKEKVVYNGFWRRFDLNRNFPEIAGRKIVAYFDFETSVNPEITVKVALSGVSTAGALKNLQAETGGKSFEVLRKEVTDRWNKELSCFHIEGSSDQKAMFYTSLYHTMINPSVYIDVDQLYRGVDNNIHKASGFTNYTIFSLWDTYRAEHPLLNLIKPFQNADMVESMIKHQQQSVHGMLPVWSLMGNENWCMSGYHAVSVLADAITKGTFSNKDEALKAMVSTSKVPYYEGLADYIRLGYVPFDKSATAASTTLEYAYDDWTIYQTALNSGNMKQAEIYRKRALNYRNIYDTTLGYARPRYSDGSFKKDFDILQTYGEGFIEGNSLNFSFQVPHDVFGMIKLMGGNKAFIQKLDHLFSMHLPEKYYKDNEDITKDCLVGGYVHGNEPSHHVPYLYAWTSQPWKTQYWIREILNRMYKNSIDGLGGNDDCGQMSAWYIFSVMGFYPVCPGTDQYVLGAPYLPYLCLNLPNGRKLEIIAKGISEINRYVKTVKWNGHLYNKLYVTHEELLKGGRLEFEMSRVPNRKRGTKFDEKPYSMTNDVK
jgi:predicted alpha-1,2-mannosidase